MEKVLCTAYGDSNNNKGIAIICEKNDLWFLDYLKVPGKCNFCIEYDGTLYVSVGGRKNQMMEFRKEEDSYILKGSYETKYFYSHGVVYRGNLILASFSDGADAVYDRRQHRESDIFVHSRKNTKAHGRSHYVGITPDDKYVYAVDNGLQQIYLYSIEKGKLNVVSVREFSDENIRLMPYSNYSKKAYLNTEKTNRIYILDYHDDAFHIQSIEDMESSEKCFSGANSISEDGRYLCVSLRGDDILQYYRIEADGSLKLLSRVSCGAMPRDVLFRKNRVYVTCTDQNTIEVYDTEDEDLKKISEIRVVQPVTFACT